MKRFFQAVLVMLGVCFGCSNSDILSPASFTSEFAGTLEKSSPGLKVEITRDLQLKVTTTNGRETTSFLDNAYDKYKQDPKSKDVVIQRYVAASLETVAGMQTPGELDRTRIVPVIKDRPWLEETRIALMNRGAKESPEIVYEDLNSDLIILYAEDSPKSIQYLRPKDLEKAHIEKKNLRSLACENLKRLLPKIERHGTNGFYMITAGGDYEASLLLLDSVWSDLQKDVRGNIIVAIPTRDLLLVTGSQDTQGIEKMKQIVDEAMTGGSYHLTPKLFVFGDGKFDEFKQ